MNALFVVCDALERSCFACGTDTTPTPTTPTTAAIFNTACSNQTTVTNQRDDEDANGPDFFVETCDGGDEDESCRRRKINNNNNKAKKTPLASSKPEPLQALPRVMESGYQPDDDDDDDDTFGTYDTYDTFGGNTLQGDRSKLKKSLRELPRVMRYDDDQMDDDTYATYGTYDDTYCSRSIADNDDGEDGDGDGDENDDDDYGDFNFDKIGLDIIGFVTNVVTSKASWATNISSSNTNGDDDDATFATTTTSSVCNKSPKNSRDDDVIAQKDSMRESLGDHYHRRKNNLKMNNNSNNNEEWSRSAIGDLSKRELPSFGTNSEFRSFGNKHSAEYDHSNYYGGAAATSFFKPTFITSGESVLLHEENNRYTYITSRTVPSCSTEMTDRSSTYNKTAAAALSAIMLNNNSQGYVIPGNDDEVSNSNSSARNTIIPYSSLSTIKTNSSFDRVFNIKSKSKRSAFQFFKKAYYHIGD